MNPPDHWPHAAIASLPPLQRQVFLLRVRDGLALPAVAARTRLQPGEAGAMLVLACRRVAAASPGRATRGRSGYDWLLEARELLRQAPATGPTQVPPPAVQPRGAGATVLPWLLVGLLAAAIGAGWWLWRPVRIPTPPAPASDPVQPVVELGPADAALAAPDLALLQRVGIERTLLEAFEFHRWLVGELAPELSPATALAVPAPATGHGPGPLDWESLPPAERATLVAWAPQWPHLAVAQRRLLADNATRWAGLEPAEQERLLQRLEEWQQLPARARAALRLRFEALQRLAPAEQAAMQAAHARFAALPEPRRAALQQSFEALPAGEREALLLPAAERAVAELAQQVFSFVPAGERADTLAMLAALPESGRERLKARVARMAPWQRDALRRELLAVTPEQRQQLLQPPP